MVWFKVDDGLTSSRKWLSIPKKHRFEALGVWTWAGSWSAKELTDGMIPEFMLNEWGVRKIVKDHLVSAGLWSEVRQNVCHLKWAEYQPMKADVEAEREKNREKLRLWRIRQRAETAGETESVTGYEPDTNPAPDPTRPDPTPSSTKKEVLLSDADASDQGTLIPDEWRPNQTHIDKAASLHLDVKHEYQRFRAASVQKQRRLKNWNTGFTNWLRKTAEFNVQRQGSSVTALQSKADKNFAEYQRLYGSGDGGEGSVPALDPGVG